MFFPLIIHYFIFTSIYTNLINLDFVVDFLILLNEKREKRLQTSCLLNYALSNTIIKQKDLSFSYFQSEIPWLCLIRWTPKI